LAQKVASKFTQMPFGDDETLVELPTDDALHLSQVSEKMENTKKHHKVLRPDILQLKDNVDPDNTGTNGPLSKKDYVKIQHMNTQRTMILYFCIMTVLMCCCLGRCLVVPISQASRYELNTKKHIAKMDKNAMLQQEVV
jgi:hypothetical protein